MTLKEFFDSINKEIKQLYVDALNAHLRKKASAAVKLLQLIPITTSQEIFAEYIEIISKIIKANHDRKISSNSGKRIKHKDKINYAPSDLLLSILNVIKEKIVSLTKALAKTTDASGTKHFSNDFENNYFTYVYIFQEPGILVQINKILLDSRLSKTPAALSFNQKRKLTLPISSTVEPGDSSNSPTYDANLSTRTLSSTTSPSSFKVTMLDDLPPFDDGFDISNKTPDSDSSASFELIAPNNSPSSVNSNESDDERIQILFGHGKITKLI